MNRKPLPRWVGYVLFYGSWLAGFALMAATVTHR